MRLLRAIAVAAACVAVAGCDVGGDSDRPPQLGAKASDEEAAVKLGFPSSATRNTIRVGGGDAAADAAGVANALFPATTDTTRPTAVVLVDEDDWQGGITAAGLAGRPIGAPLLVADGDDLPPVTRDTLDRLRPKGSDLAKDAQVIRVGEDTARPSGFKTAVIEGDDPYERAAAVDRFFSAAKGRASANVLVVSGESAEFGMPAAAWSARSGDSVLLVRRGEIPEATQRALRQHDRPNIYVLGPLGVVSAKVERELGRFGRVRRIQGRTPVENAIAFARYERGRFGWGVTVPGFNFTVASVKRPLDVAAAASLATRGVFAPLLLTDQAGELPDPLESYFASVQPGYEEDPGEAVYNRIWILGDDRTISVRQQTRIDQLAELIPVQSQAP